MKTIDVTLLPEPTRKRVLMEYRRALMDPAHEMTYEECAWLYGYTYATIRWAASKGRLATVGRNPNKRVRHEDMRRYMVTKKKVGTPRKSQRNLQISLIEQASN